MAEAGPLLGALLELDIGAPAAGGSCVARHGSSGRVVFVRHALPGERVRARVTEDRGGSFCRADAVEILQAAPDRVPPPCEYAGPGRCGGCDWQHASGPAQRTLKQTVLYDQFARIAQLDLTGLLHGVEELPGGLLGWRTRINYAVDGAGRAGLHRHGTHAVELVQRCPLGMPGVGDAPVLARRWPGCSGVEVVVGDDQQRAVLERRAAPDRRADPRGAPRAAQRGRGGRRPPDRVTQVAGPQRVLRTVRDRGFQVSAGGFWQVHPAAAQTIADALLDAVSPRAGDAVLDLYAGAGALTAALADAVGPTGRVVGVETDERAVADAEANLADLPWAQVRAGRVGAGTVDTFAAGLDGTPDLVVLDPPRAGAGADVLAAVLALSPRAVGYVSCDAGTLARDVAAAARLGWQLGSLRAFDAFPMTAHVECLATLVPDPLPQEPGVRDVASSG